MGIEHKKRLKEQYGKKAVVGLDCVNMGIADASGTLSSTSLVDPFGVSHYKLYRPGKLDAVTVMTNPALPSANTLTVNIIVNEVERGEVVFAVGQSGVDKTFQSELFHDVVLASGDVVKLTATASLNTNVDISARASIRLYE